LSGIEISNGFQGISEKDRIDKNFFFFFPQYVSFDIVSAGFDKK